jgi:hypothetical protein
MKVKKKEGRMEYWSIGVMEYWKDQKTGDRIERNKRMEYWSIGVMEYWKEGKTPAACGTAEDGRIGKAGENWHT